MSMGGRVIRLPVRLQIIDRQTLRTPKNVKIPRPSHRRIARHAFPRCQFLTWRTCRALARACRKLGQIRHILVVVIVIVGIQKVLLPGASFPNAREWRREGMTDRARMTATPRRRGGQVWVHGWQKLGILRKQGRRSPLVWNRDEGRRGIGTWRRRVTCGTRRHMGAFGGAGSEE